MSKSPWERQPLPSKGNSDPAAIYIGIGRVLNQWEETELQLGSLYTAFALRFQDWEALTQYGACATSENRLETLRQSAKRFFIAHADQKLEGDFFCLMRRAKRFKERRHDVAHAMVRDDTWAHWIIIDERSMPRQPKGYFLLPTHYKRNRFNDSFIPEYAYNSESLKELEYNLTQFSLEIMGFAHYVSRYSRPLTTL
jgi:hypothetical protein